MVAVAGQRTAAEEVRPVAEKGETVSFAAAVVAGVSAAVGVAAAVVVVMVSWTKVAAVEMVC